MKPAAAAVLLAACAILALWILPHPQFTPDGMVYARYAARDAGYSERDATLAVRRYYEATPLVRVPRYRALVEIDPSVAFARSQIFSNRVLYPAFAAALLPVAGFRALFLVSAIAYVAFAMALFWMLSSFSRASIAAVLAITAIAFPLTRASAASDLTDMLSMVWWTVALAAILRGLRDPALRWPLVLAAASILLVLTRPTPYLTIVPAAAAGLAMGSWLLFCGSLAGIAGYAVLALATRAFGLREQLHWVYAHRPGADAGVAESAWYRSSIASSVRFTVVEMVRTVLPIAGIAAWFYALRARALVPEVIVLASSALACTISVPFNPVPSSIDRVVILPLVPVCCTALAIAFERVAAGNRSGHAFQPERGAKASAENCAPL